MATDKPPFARTVASAESVPSRQKSDALQQKAMEFVEYFRYREGYDQWHGFSLQKRTPAIGSDMRIHAPSLSL